jgi:hypothetical protein
MKTVQPIGSFLTHTALVIWQGFLAFFRFTEEDVRILLSAYGYHAPEIDQFQDSRLDEGGKSAVTPQKVRRHSPLGPAHGQILLGVHPEVTSMTFSTASRKHLRRQRQV